MENEASTINAWITVIVAAIVALSTLGGAFLQNWFSHRRFKVELGRAIEIESRKRKWEVRSEPLLKLREELAVMATKANNVTTCIKVLLLYGHDVNKLSKEEVKKVFKLPISDCENVVNDLKGYFMSGPFNQTLFTLDDKIIIDKVGGLVKEYIDMLGSITPKLQKLVDVIAQPELPLDQFEEPIKSAKAFEGIVRETQALINQRLEEL